MSRKSISCDIYENQGVYGQENSQFGNRQRIRTILKYVKQCDDVKRVLDIGCGTGFLTYELKKLSSKFEVIGIDISKTALKIARSKYKDIKFLEVDAELKFPFEKNYFDLIVSGEHIEHLKDVDTYLVEINRVLRKKGYLILSTPNLASWMNRILLLIGRQPLFLEPSLRKTLPIINIFGHTFPNDLSILPSGHLRLYTLDALKKLLNVYNLTILSTKGRTIFEGRITKIIDICFSFISSLSYGFIIKSQKLKNI